MLKVETVSVDSISIWPKSLLYNPFEKWLKLLPLSSPMLLTNSCEVKRIIYQANIDCDIAGYK